MSVLVQLEGGSWNDFAPYPERRQRFGWLSHRVRHECMPQLVRLVEDGSGCVKVCIDVRGLWWLSSENGALYGFDGWLIQR